jgi:hypothetical protein
MLGLCLSLMRALLAICPYIYIYKIKLGFDMRLNLQLLVNLNNSDANGRVRRFHKLMTEWGFARLLSHDTLNESSNGYLVDDTCVFGVEVFVIKGTCRGESLSMVNQPQPNYFTWRIDNYMALKDEVYFSEQFTVEGRRWYARLAFALLYQSHLQLNLLVLLYIGYNLYHFILNIGS